MRDIERHMGKLVPLDLPGDTIEERAQAACEKFEFEKESYHSSYVDCLKDEGYGKVYIYNDVIYEVQNKESNPYDGFGLASFNDDGSIDYHIMYHNGGVGFDEVIDVAVKEAILNEL